MKPAKPWAPAFRRLIVSGLWLQGASVRGIAKALARAGQAVCAQTVHDDLVWSREWNDAKYEQQIRDLQGGER